MQGHCEDPIFKNREALSPDYIPENLPNRMEEICAINQVIEESLEGNITHILIAGPPGTGKTAAIKLIFNRLRSKPNALFCYLNCFNKSTKMGALYSMVLDFFREKKPTRKMPSRRGIAYDELLDSFKKELEKANTGLVVCLDEVDQLEEPELIHDLIRTGWGNGCIQVIGISNDPTIFKDLDPRTKSRLYPLKEFYFQPYTFEEMKDIIKARADEAFHEGIMDDEPMDYLARFTVNKNGDVRIVRETLMRAGESAKHSGDQKVRVKHIKERLNQSQHARSISVINSLTNQERFILRLIPKEGAYYQDLYRIYQSTDGRFGDRMLRNYMERFRKLRLISLERKGVGGSYFITLNTPKEVLFEIS